MTDAERIARDELGHSFIRLLIGDVLAARERLAADDTQRHRRDTIRSTFAAIEGVVWMYREHVREIARDMGVLTPTADLALRERTFRVSDRGDIVEQVRFVTLPTIIRLATKQAQLIEPSVAIDYTEVGWTALRTSIEVRNRVTHPKNRADLQISTDELKTVAIAFSWLLSITETAIGQINASFRHFISEMRDVLGALNRGDPEALSAYRAAIRNEDD